jgi:hypothetical protein
MDEYGYRNVWYLGYMNVEKYNAALMQTQLWNKKTFHAAELETSIMLHISPEKVRMEKAVREEPEVPAGLDSQADTLEGILAIRPVWKRCIGNGGERQAIFRVVAERPDANRYAEYRLTASAQNRAVSRDSSMGIKNRRLSQCKF